MDVSTFFPNLLRRLIPARADQIRYLHGLGYKALDFDFSLAMLDAHKESSAHAFYLDDSKRALEDTGAYCGQAHSPCGNPFTPGYMEEAVEQLQYSFEACAFLGIPQMVIHPGCKSGNTKEEFFDINIAFFRRILPMAEATGVDILVENIGAPHDEYFIRSGQALRELIEGINHPMVFACWDTGHANHSKEFCQYESIMALGDKLHALHVQDNLGDFEMTERCERADIHTLPYLGNSNYDSILQGLVDIGYKGTFNFEVDAPKPNDNRLPFVYQGELVSKLSYPSIEIMSATLKLLHQIGIHMLRTYNLT